MSSVNHIAILHATLARRDTPEAVARIVYESLPDRRSGRAASLIKQMIKTSLKNRWGWSSMPTQFRSPDGMGRQLAKAEELGKAFLKSDLRAPEDADGIEDFVSEFNALIGKVPGRSSFRHDRMNHAARIGAGIELSRRRYTKLFRLAGRLEDRLRRFRQADVRHRLLMVSKAALAPDLEPEDLNGSLPAAAFIAYYCARMKLRSEFTIAGQQMPFDALSEELFKLCQKTPNVPWHAIAHVFPRDDVLVRLTDDQKVRLLRRWYDILMETAQGLDEAFRRTDIDLDRMVVRKGNDSSTWNLLAGAWNRSRDHWIALVQAMGMDSLFDEMLPGKVMRLMAADVAAWHRMSGGGLHPDTAVWRELPKPWRVLTGEETCNRARIATACARHKIDPERTGWTAPRPRTEVATFRPTPELVHGVAVDNPFLASLLRRMGAFSGKALRPHGLDQTQD